MAAHDDSQSFECQLDAIKIYFDPEEWQDFSPYEKKRFIKIKTNYENLLAIGANPVMPTFMRQEIRTEYMTYTEADAKKRKLDPDSSKANATNESEVLNCDARGEGSEDDVEIIEEGFRQNAYRPRIKWENIQHGDSEPFIPDESDMENIDMLLEGVRMNLDHLRSLCKNPDADCCDTEEQPANERRAARYPKRNVPKVSYEEEQVSSEDDYIYCDDCGQPYEESCPQHGPLKFVQDKKAARGPRHAWNTCPDYLSVCRSGIRGAGLGVWTEKKLEKGYVFGPYKGKIVKSRKEAKDSGYAWEIRRSGKVLHYIDGRDIFVSNFLRFVNCAVCEERQNLIAFQWHGQIWYRVYKEVKAYTELLVWYGDEFGEELGIFRDEERLTLKGEMKKCEYGRGLAPSSSSSMRNCNTSREIAQHSENAPNHPSHRQNVNSSRVRYKYQRSQRSEMGSGNSSASDARDQCAVVKRVECSFDEKKRAIIGQNNRARNTDAIGKIHMCPQYNYKTANICTLRRHINVHECRRPYQCEMCHYSSNRAGNLRVHVADVHEGRRPYKCQKCDYRAAHANILRSHVRAVHDGERSHHCPHCDYRSAYSTHLRTHVRSVHDGEKPHHCPHCDYRATRSTDLRKHVRSVHEKLKPFSCKQCHFKASQHSNLRSHERAKHGGKKDANVSETDQKSHDLF